MASLLCLALLVTSWGTAASAHWSTAGVGAGSAGTSTVNPPTDVTASSASGSGDVSVSWTPSTGGTSPQGYHVRRTRSGDGLTSFACGSSATTLVSGPCTDSGVPDGTYTYVVTAVLNSWTAPSAPSAEVAVSNAVGTTTTLTSSANPSLVGQTVTYTATVSPVSGGATPTGNVTFKDGGGTITCAGGSQAVDGSGRATCDVAYAATGTRTISAVYGGAAGFAGSTSSALTQNVDQAATTTGLASSANPSKAGQTVVYTARVAVVAPGAGTPTGEVTFKDGGLAITCTSGSQSLNAMGEATCGVAHTAAGTRSITAAYAGTADFAGSASDALVQAVDQSATSTGLAASVNPARTGQAVTFTATVTATGPGSGTPTGTVTFQDGAAAMPCSGGSQSLNASGVATCQIAFGTTGVRSITAVFNGDADYATSTSTALSHTVEKAGTVTTVTSSANPAKTGNTVTFTATVAATSPGGGTPTGTVVFKDGGATIGCGVGSQPLDGGQATCQTSFSGVSNRTITAEYQGSDHYTASTSAALTQKVRNSAVAGLVFTNVRTGPSDTTLVTRTPTCTGAVGTTYSCTVSGLPAGQSGNPNNHFLYADVAFATAAGVATVYSADASPLTLQYVGKAHSSTSTSIAANTHTTGTSSWTQRSGNSPASVTVTFTENSVTWRAVITFN